MFDVIGMLKEGMVLFREQWEYWKGGQTHEQRRLERELADALEQKRYALQQGFLDTANHWDSVARRLRDEIAAKYSR